jgi:hypothetical protein
MLKMIGKNLRNFKIINTLKKIHYIPHQKINSQANMIAENKIAEPKKKIPHPQP